MPPDRTAPQRQRPPRGGCCGESKIRFRKGDSGQGLEQEQWRGRGRERERRRGQGQGLGRGTEREREREVRWELVLEEEV